MAVTDPRAARAATGRRAGSRLRSSIDELDVSAIARQRGGGGHRQAAGFSSDGVGRGDHRVRRAASSPMPPRALEPSGLVLVDKPAGPSSFAGGRGDPAPAPARAPATRARSTRSRPGCCSCCLGRGDEARAVLRRARQALRHRGRPDRAHVDRRPRGRGRRALEPPGRAELERRLDGLRGEVELPIPAASAVKIGGERAYRLHRRGRGVEMPVRRSRVDALERARVRRRRRAPRPARQLRHVRPGDRGRARRPLPHAAAHRGRAVRGRRGGRRADPVRRPRRCRSCPRSRSTRTRRRRSERAGAARQPDARTCATASWSPSAGGDAG